MATADQQPKTARLGFLPRFGRAREGATAVEFGLVVMPFMVMIFGVFELGLMLLMQGTLDSSAHDAARTIRTGQFQAGGGTATDYKNAICHGLGWMTQDCEANLYVDVRVFPNFAAVNAPMPIANNAFDPNQVQFQTTTACAIVLARAFYNWTLLAPDLSYVPHMAGNKVLLTASAAFRNEPYSGQTC